jgi:hypothetical protein
MTHKNVRSCVTTKEARGARNRKSPQYPQSILRKFRVAIKLYKLTFEATPAKGSFVS